MRGTAMAKAPRRPAGELRERVLRMLQRSKRPLSGFELTDRLGERGKRLHHSQIFRALDQLCRGQIIRKVALTSGYAFGGDTRQVSLLCSACGEIVAVEAEAGFALLDRLAASKRFMVGSYVVEVPGICRKCGDARRPDQDPSQA